MDKSLIDKAKEIAKQQEITRKHDRDQHLKEIYDEVLRILEDCITNEKIYNGRIKIRTHNFYQSSHSGSLDYGYYDWDYNNIFVWASEGREVAEMIRNNEGINCDYYFNRGDDDYFYFNFNG